jgi:hypothetical protein
LGATGPPWPAVGGARAESPFLLGAKAQGAPVAHDAFAAAAHSLFAQRHGQARTAVNLAMRGKEFRHPQAQTRVVEGARTVRPLTPGVVGTARHAQSQAKIGEGIRVGHTLDQGIPVGGRSDSMPKAFFRIS